MTHPDFNIFDVSAAGKGRSLVYAGGIARFVRSLGKFPQNAHISLYRYPSAIKTFMQEHEGTTAGYDGPCYGDYIPFEIDTGKKEDADQSENIRISCEAARAIVSAVMEQTGLPASMFSVYFSGNRGIHQFVRTECFGEFEPGPDFHDVLYTLAVRLLEPSGIIKVGESGRHESETLDMQVYSAQHMIRMPNTIHETTGNYKVRIDQDMLDDVSQIMDACRQPRLNDPSPVLTNETSLRIGNEVRALRMAGKLVARPRGRRSTFAASVSDLENIPGMGRFVQKDRSLSRLLEGFMSDGETRVGVKGRREALVKISYYLRGRGIPRDIAWSIVSTWNATNDPSLEADKLQINFDSIYRKSL